MLEEELKSQEQFFRNSAAQNAAPLRKVPNGKIGNSISEEKIA